MYAIEENKINISHHWINKELTTFKRSHWSDAVIEAGTDNGECGDSTASYIRLYIPELLAIKVNTVSTDGHDDDLIEDHTYNVEFIIRGECERDMMISAMEFALQVLKEGQEGKL